MNVAEVVTLVVLIVGGAAVVVGLIRGDAEALVVGAGLIGGPAMVQMKGDQSDEAQ